MELTSLASNLTRLNNSFCATKYRAVYSHELNIVIIYKQRLPINTLHGNLCPKLQTGYRSNFMDKNKFHKM